MPANLKINQSEQFDENQNTKAFSLKLGHFVYLAGLVLGVYALFQMFFMVRLTAGISAEKPVPKYYATVEIVNASGMPQISKAVTDFLKSKSGPELELVFTGAERLEYRNIERTLIISRTKDTETAGRIATAFGIDNSEVVYRPPVEKDMSPKVTVVLGEDIQLMLNPDKTNKES